MDDGFLLMFAGGRAECKLVTRALILENFGYNGSPARSRASSDATCASPNEEEMRGCAAAADARSTTSTYMTDPIRLPAIGGVTSLPHPG
jgi:hypothetical protein